MFSELMKPGGVGARLRSITYDSLAMIRRVLRDNRLKKMVRLVCSIYVSFAEVISNLVVATAYGRRCSHVSIEGTKLITKTVVRTFRFLRPRQRTIIAIATAITIAIATTIAIAIATICHCHCHRHHPFPGVVSRGAGHFSHGKRTRRRGTRCDPKG